MEHIENQKLLAVVTKNLVLEENEVEHLKTCEECMEVIRVIVRQNISKGANG